MMVQQWTSATPFLPRLDMQSLVLHLTSPQSGSISSKTILHASVLTRKTINASVLRRKTTTMGSTQANVDVQVCKVDDPNLLEMAFRVRENVFVEEQGVDRADEIDRFEDISHHFVALGCDGNGVGAARWRTTEKGVKLERFSVDKSLRGRGVGSKLVAAVLEDIRATKGPGQLLYLHSQLPAVQFYERHGFSKVGEKFSECDIWHYMMERKH